MVNVAQWSLMKKIILGLAVLIIIWIGWALFLGENKATEAIRELPDGQLEIVNENDEEVQLDIKIGSNATNLNNVKPELLSETVIYITSKYSASATRIYEDISQDIQVAFFGPEDELLKIFDIPANTTQKITPEKRYQHILIAPDGFFEENNISVENGSKIK
ncbi:MAG: hypothetical protein ACOC4G_09175 [Bacillota bacterium]